MRDRIQPTQTISLSKGIVSSLACSPDGRTVAGAGGVLWSLLLGKENVIRLWDSHTRELLHTLVGHSSLVSSVAFSPDGSTLLSGSLDGTIKVWDTGTFQEQTTLNPVSSHPWKLDGKPWRISVPKIDAIALHPYQQWVAASDISEGVALWDRTSGKQMAYWGGHAAFTAIAFNPTGDLLATCDDHAGYNLYAMPTGQRVYPPDNKLVFGRIGRWSFATSAPSLKTLRFSLDGTVLAGGCLRGSIRFWDIATGKERSRIRAHQGCVTSLLFSAGGQYLASAGVDGKIKLWDRQTAQQICTFEGHTKEVRSLALSCDGSTLVSSSSDRTIRFWKSQFLAM